MELYESDRYSFSIQHPMGWESLNVDPQDLTAGWATQEGSAFTISEEDLVAQTSESFSLAEYTDLVIAVLSANLTEFELLSSEPLLTSEGFAAQVLELTALGGFLKGQRLIYLDDSNVGFNAAYAFPANMYEEQKPLIKYSFGTFKTQIEAITERGVQMTDGP